MLIGPRTNWLRAYAHFIADRNHRSVESCPNCGDKAYQLRNVADPQTRMGYALFWCESCVHGISVSRAQAREDVPIWPLDDPAALADVPDFIRVGEPQDLPYGQWRAEKSAEV